MVLPTSTSPHCCLDLLDGSGEQRVRFDVSDAGDETAMVLGEMYLRGEEWKFRAVGQSWDRGLAGLAVDYGTDPAEAALDVAEQERRATSTLLSTMIAVRDFGRALVARFGGPAGTIETYLEVPFTLDERTSIPDGVIRVARAGRVWTALLEVQTGTSPLRQEQVERYPDLARQQGYDASSLCPPISPR